MGYYTDVYLRKLNRFGNNLQERIVNKREYDFNNFVKKSPNRVVVYDQDKKFEGVLQSKTYNEIETVDYFLTYKSINISSGTILKIMDIKNNNIFTYWIVICKDNFVSCGYDRYTVIKLDREIRWITDEGYLFKALVHISGAGANARDKRITSSYKIVEESVSYLPTQTLTITMKDNPQIKRGVRINIKDKIWKISGVENVSNDGVCYITLEQDYEDELRDKSFHIENEPPGSEGIADGYKFERWNFTCSLDSGETIIYEDKEYPLIEIDLNTAGTPIDFSPYYFDVEDNSEVIIDIQDKDIVEYKDRSLYGLEKGETVLTVLLKDSPDVQKKYVVKVVNEEVKYFTIDAPSRLKMCQTHKLYSNQQFSIKQISPIEDRNNILIGKLQKEEDGRYYRTISINKIINNLTIVFSNILINQDDEVSEDIDTKTIDNNINYYSLLSNIDFENMEMTFTKSFVVESLWIGGI